MSTRSRAAPWFRSSLAVEDLLFTRGTQELVRALLWSYVRAPVLPVNLMLETENLALDMERAFEWSEPGLFRWIVPDDGRGFRQREDEQYLEARRRTWERYS